MKIMMFAVLLTSSLFFTACQIEDTETEATIQEETSMQNATFRSEGESVFIAVPEDLQASPDFPVEVAEYFLEVTDPFTGELRSGYLIEGFTLEGEERKIAFWELTGSLIDITSNQDPNGPVTYDDYLRGCLLHCNNMGWNCDYCADDAMERCLGNPDCYCDVTN